MLLEKEPNNIQAQSLKQLVEAAVAKGAFAFHFVLPALQRTDHWHTLDLRIQRATSAWPSQAEQLPRPVSSLQLSWAQRAVDSSLPSSHDYLCFVLSVPACSTHHC